MKYAISRCPTCGGTPVVELNRAPVFAGIIENDDGRFDFAGDSKVDWNAQEAWLDENGLTHLHCAERHWWETDVKSEPTT